MKPEFPHQGHLMCATAAETQAFGEQVGAALEAGDLVILKGPVGAGKTTLTQGIARGMRVSGRVTSPTFVIAREHPSEVGGPSLIHVDAYRLGSTGADPLDEIDALDLDTDLTEAVVVAEWGEGLMEQLSTNHLVLTLDRSQDVRELSWEIVS